MFTVEGSAGVLTQATKLRLGSRALQDMRQLRREEQLLAEGKEDDAGGVNGLKRITYNTEQRDSSGRLVPDAQLASAATDQGRAMVLMRRGDRAKADHLAASGNRRRCKLCNVRALTSCVGQ